MAGTTAQKQPDDAQNGFNLALYLLAAGQQPEALDLYRQTKGTDPSPTTIHGAVRDLQTLALLLGQEAVRKALDILGDP